MNHASQATRTLAGFVEDIHSQIENVIHMGDATEALYPTKQYSPRFAQEQALPLARVLQKHTIPLTQLSGNTDPYYDPEVQDMVRTVLRLTEEQNPAEETARHIWSDPNKNIPLKLPGLAFAKGSDFYTHGQWADDLKITKDSYALMHDVLSGNVSPQVLTYLRRSENSHGMMGTIYVGLSWAIAAGPKAVRQWCDRTLESITTAKQSKVLAEQTRRYGMNPRLLVAGHIHAPKIIPLDNKQAYLNPGTLTSVVKFDVAEPRSTFATITGETTHRTIRLFACKGNTIEEFERYDEAY